MEEVAVRVEPSVAEGVESVAEVQVVEVVLASEPG